MDPPRAGTPSRSPVRSPSINRSPASLQKRAELLGFLEQAVVVLLSQATRYLIDPALQSHDKLQLKKELANELVSAFLTCLPCCSNILLHVTD